ncbi:hypothetical protein GUJ93_ZPchr0009g1856 [Zizania palustris]|uniref:Uncharacterized protein n=1 Tax=Zizania palustris TaxID=103762 RepID=A0A8J5UY19_ZIZPA|nr:hypothetical protein GUJ93_ZPchr0009g1856 [Zizania palustris]
MNVTRVVKDWLKIIFPWFVIWDTATPINLFGYGITFLGMTYYNHVKLEVKRKSSHNARLLLLFVVACPDDSKLYPFLQNVPGPDGLTPLHLATSIEDAKDFVDALTDDPQQVVLFISRCEELQVNDLDIWSLLQNVCLVPGDAGADGRKELNLKAFAWWWCLLPDQLIEVGSRNDRPSGLGRLGGVSVLLLRARQEVRSRPEVRGF